MVWTVYLTRKAHKQLVRLPQFIQDLADLAVADLEEQGIQPQGWNTLKTDLSGLRWYSFYLTLGIGWRSIKSCCVRLQGHRELRYYCPLNYYWRRNISSLILISISALRINSRLNHNQFLNVDLIKINRALTSRRRSCRWPRRHRRTWGSHRRHRYLQDTTIVI